MRWDWTPARLRLSREAPRGARSERGREVAPVDRNKPGTLAELYTANDVELFDLQADPLETVNLAVDREKRADLIATMSGKLETLTKAEIGDDNGREMPELSTVTWTIDRPDL